MYTPSLPEDRAEDFIKRIIKQRLDRGRNNGLYRQTALTTLTSAPKTVTFADSVPPPIE